MRTIQFEINDELEARIQKIADRNAVSLEEAAKWVIATNLTPREKPCWMESITELTKLLSKALDSLPKTE